MLAHVVNYVDQGPDGEAQVSNALVFKEPVDGTTFRRVWVLSEHGGGGGYVQKDDGSDIPQAESPNGDYSDLSRYGVTWHKKQA